jgi:hypothetical protein
MMNRRASVRAHSHWRPRRGTPRAPVDGTGSTGHRRGRLWLALGITTVLGFGVVFETMRSAHADVPALPATPTAWLEAFSAGVATSNGDVCSRLLSSAFRSAFVGEVHRSCATYYSHAQVLSVRVLRILRSGATAAVEIRYWPRGGYTTFVLNRQDRGWQAVAIVPGGPLPVA